MDSSTSDSRFHAILNFATKWKVLSLERGDDPPKIKSDGAEGEPPFSTLEGFEGGLLGGDLSE